MPQCSRVEIVYVNKLKSVLSESRKNKTKQKIGFPFEKLTDRIVPSQQKSNCTIYRISALLIKWIKNSFVFFNLMVFIGYIATKKSLENNGSIHFSRNCKLNWRKIEAVNEFRMVHCDYCKADQLTPKLIGCTSSSSPNLIWAFSTGLIFLVRVRRDFLLCAHFSLSTRSVFEFINGICTLLHTHFG